MVVWSDGRKRKEVSVQRGKNRQEIQWKIKTKNCIIRQKICEQRTLFQWRDNVDDDDDDDDDEKKWKFPIYSPRKLILLSGSHSHSQVVPMINTNKKDKKYYCDRKNIFRFRFKITTTTTTTIRKESTNEKKNIAHTNTHTLMRKTRDGQTAKKLLCA